MPLTFDLRPIEQNGILNTDAARNQSAQLTTTTSEDTVTIQVAGSTPRVIMFLSTEDIGIKTSSTATGATKPTLLGGAAFQFEVPVTTVFYVQNLSAGGTLTVQCLR